MSVGLQNRISTALRTEETVPELQVHWLIPVMDGDIEMRQLRSGSHHYWEENKATNAQMASLWFIPAGAPGTSGAVWCYVWP